MAGGYMTKAPVAIMCTTVISRETSRIALMIAALNDLEMKSADILNAYIHALVTGKEWTVLGVWK